MADKTNAPERISWQDLKKNSDGLVPVIVQEASTGRVLMEAYMNEEAYDKTLAEGLMTYWSRSRRALWTKGETSGHFQHVSGLYADCDLDNLLAVVEQEGAACHTGHHSCFYRSVTGGEIGGPHSWDPKAD